MLAGTPGNMAPPPARVPTRKPTPLELVSRKTRFRPPRERVTEDGKKVRDDPKERSGYGAATVALGLSALGFARLRLRRIAAEKRLIKQMWDQHTTVRGLRIAAEAGEPLPETVMVRGWLSARGPPVESLAARVPQLGARLGAIDQPENLYLKLAERVKSGELEAPEDIKEWSKQAQYHDDFTRADRAPTASLLVRELLVTRLGCEAVRKEKEDKEGRRRVEITRKARTARFNVFHDRAVAEGLHVVGLAGESADLVLPAYGEAELRAHAAPSLFLSLPDALNEFKRWSSFGIINADKSLTHLSRFVHLDQSSDMDDGSFRAAASRAGAGGAGLVVASDGGAGALEALGKLKPSGWLWNGKGFYDNNSSDDAWMSHYGVSMVSFPEFAQRLATAREENCRHQRASEWDYHTMQQMRDEENCFRFVELGISASEVVVVARPHYEGGQIVLRPPVAKEVGEAQFEFRILKGHTAEQLLKHRNASVLVFVGFAVMGLATIAAGEEMIRDSVEVVEVL